MNESKRSKSLIIVIILLIASLISSFYKINDLTAKIDNLEKSFNNQIQTMNGQINSIYSDVDTKLKEQNSLLSEFTYKNGRFSPESNQAEIIMEFVPKILTDNMELYVSFGGKEIPCTRNKGKFSATLTVDAFKYYEEKPVLNINTTTETKTEVLDDMYIEYLYTNHLGSLNAHSAINSNNYKNNLKQSKNERKINFSGSVYFDYWKNTENNTKNNIKKAFISVEVNGKEATCYDVTDKLVLSEDNLVGDISLADTFNVKLNDNIEFFANIEDSYGYTHKCLVEKHIVSDKNEEFYEYSSDEEIYDKNNKLLTN